MLYLGSPPHTRGILYDIIPTGRCNWFTPAYAGNTAPPSRRRHEAWVHPRIRGEYYGPDGGAIGGVGSPPHTRGIRRRRANALSSSGFTPAYAGNTNHIHTHKRSCQVHPRIRGEYAIRHAEDKAREGSPPHTRGILRDDVVVAETLGFTPAYAGNTRTADSKSACGGVHPRIRGEYKIFSVEECTKGGSPPHTRGIQINVLECGEIRRFTPAYAGNTVPVDTQALTAWVHPRIRGEYSILPIYAVCISGSPPHTRGILRIRGFGSSWPRFTPAYAGNTRISNR